MYFYVFFPVCVSQDFSIDICSVLAHMMQHDTNENARFIAQWFYSSEESALGLGLNFLSSS